MGDRHHEAPREANPGIGIMFLKNKNNKNYYVNLFFHRKICLNVSLRAKQITKKHG